MKTMDGAILDSLFQLTLPELVLFMTFLATEAWYGF
jgi:hypothetical protein